MSSLVEADSLSSLGDAAGPPSGARSWIYQDLLDQLAQKEPPTSGPYLRSNNIAQVHHCKAGRAFLIDGWCRVPVFFEFCSQTSSCDEDRRPASSSMVELHLYSYNILRTKDAMPRVVLVVEEWQSMDQDPQWNIKDVFDVNSLEVIQRDLNSCHLPELDRKSAVDGSMPDCDSSSGLTSLLDAMSATQGLDTSCEDLNPATSRALSSQPQVKLTDLLISDSQSLILDELSGWKIPPKAHSSSPADLNLDARSSASSQTQAQRVEVLQDSKLGSSDSLFSDTEPALTFTGSRDQEERPTSKTDHLDGLVSQGSGSVSSDDDIYIFSPHGNGNTESCFNDVLAELEVQTEEGSAKSDNGLLSLSDITADTGSLHTTIGSQTNRSNCFSGTIRNEGSLDTDDSQDIPVCASSPSPERCLHRDNTRRLQGEQEGKTERDKETIHQESQTLSLNKRGLFKTQLFSERSCHRAHSVDPEIPGGEAGAPPTPAGRVKKMWQRKSGRDSLAQRKMIDERSPVSKEKKMWDKKIALISPTQSSEDQVETERRSVTCRHTVEIKVVNFVGCRQTVEMRVVDQSDPTVPRILTSPRGRINFPVPDSSRSSHFIVSSNSCWEQGEGPPTQKKTDLSLRKVESYKRKIDDRKRKSGPPLKHSKVISYTEIEICERDNGSSLSQDCSVVSDAVWDKPGQLQSSPEAPGLSDRCPLPRRKRRCVSRGNTHTRDLCNKPAGTRIEESQSPVLFTSLRDPSRVASQVFESCQSRPMRWCCGGSQGFVYPPKSMESQGFQPQCSEPDMGSEHYEDWDLLNTQSSSSQDLLKTQSAPSRNLLKTQSSSRRDLLKTKSCPRNRSTFAGPALTKRDESSSKSPPQTVSMAGISQVLNFIHLGNYDFQKK